MEIISSKAEARDERSVGCRGGCSSTSGFLFGANQLIVLRRRADA